MRRIIISDKKKKDIAKELEQYFGITTSFIYPEIDYSVDKIKKRASRVVSDDFSIGNELLMCFDNKVKEIEYEIQKISKENEKDTQVYEIRMFEKKLLAWKNDLLSFIDRSKDKRDGLKHSIISKYNKTIIQYDEVFKYYITNDLANCSGDLKMEDL